MYFGGMRVEGKALLWPGWSLLSENSLKTLYFEITDSNNGKELPKSNRL